MDKKFLSFICAVSILLCACATILRTQPNISILYRIQDLKNQLPLLPAGSKLLPQDSLPGSAQELFKQLYALDPVLAIEVGRLPEFQGNVGQKQILALTRFVDIISNISPKEKSNLADLLKVGKPPIRRYCTPLQAVFWLLEKDEIHLKPNPLNYPLKDILSYTWIPFPKDRWGNFKVVTDRLNSPELINYYEQMNFNYVVHFTGCSGNAQLIFAIKEGCCKDYTAFSVYCLQKAGYDAGAIKVVSPSGRFPYHVVCEYKDNGKKYIMDNSCLRCTDGLGSLEKEKYEKRFPHIGYGYQ